MAWDIAGGIIIAFVCLNLGFIALGLVLGGAGMAVEAARNFFAGNKRP